MVVFVCVCFVAREMTMTTTILVGQVIAAAADDDNDCHDNNVIAMIVPMVGLFYVAVPLGVPYSDSNPIQSHCRIGVVCRLLTFALQHHTIHVHWMVTISRCRRMIVQGTLQALGLGFRKIHSEVSANPPSR